MARFFTRLVGGVFLSTRIAQDVAERGRQRERTLLAVQDGGKLPTRGFIGELDFLLRRHPLADLGVEDRKEALRENCVFRRVERRREVDVLLVQRVPEMIVRRADDLVEGRRAMAVAHGIEHCREIVRRDGIIGFVFGDLDHCARLRLLRLK